MLKVGMTAIITTDNWFTAPNGKNYRAVFGTIRGVYNADDFFGIKVNSKSKDWYIEIGNMTIAGCQVHYAIEASSYFDGDGENWTADACHGIKVYNTPCPIFNADLPIIQHYKEISNGIC